MTNTFDEASKILRPPRKRKVGQARDPLMEMTYIESNHGYNTEEMERIILKHPRPKDSFQTERIRDLYFNYFIRYLIAKELVANDDVPKDDEGRWDELVKARLQPYRSRIAAGEFPLNDLSFWVHFLHHAGTTGIGKINPDTAAHMNIKHKAWLGENGEPLRPSPVGMPTEFADIIRNLDPPGKDAQPLSLTSVHGIFVRVYRKLELDYGIKLEDSIKKKVRTIIAYLGYQLHWFTTTQLKKLCITELQVEHILAALWNGTLSMRATTIVRLSYHAVILFLNTFGIRETSLLDMESRPRSEEGRYLRWGDLTIRFLGYTEDGHPEFIVIGTASATKFGKRAGDALFQDFVIGIRKPNAERSIARDLAFAIICLAILQGAMSDNLLKVFQDRNYGEQLLCSISNSGLPEYDFVCSTPFQNSPVFLMPAGPTDKGAKSLMDFTPVNPNFRPMSTKCLLRQLNKVGKHIGLESTLNSGSFRRTAATRLVYDSQTPYWKISRSMQHLSNNKDLFRQTYRPTNRPVDRSDLWFGQGSSSKVVKEGVEAIGVLTYRPDPTCFEAGKIEELKDLIEQYCEDDANEEDVISAYAFINSGMRRPLEVSLEGLSLFVEGDPWRKNVKVGHPFITECKNDPVNVINYLVRLNTANSYSIPEFRTAVSGGSIQDKEEEEFEGEVVNIALENELQETLYKNDMENTSVDDI